MEEIKLQDLFTSEDVEVVSGETQELAKLDDLFKSNNFDKVDALIQASTDTFQKKFNTTRQSRKKSLIDEDYLRELISDEVEQVFENKFEKILKEVVYAVERIVLMPSNNPTSEDNDKKNVTNE